MSSDELYREVILDHHRNPRGREHLDACNAESSGMNPSCGDEVSIRLNIDGGKVVGVEVQSKGCAISTASGSMLAETAKGLDLNALKDLAAMVRNMLKTGELEEGTNIGDFEALLGISRFPVRVKCAMLPIATLLQAVEAYHGDGDASSAISTEEVQ